MNRNNSTMKVIEVSVGRDERKSAYQGGCSNPHVILAHFSFATRCVSARFFDPYVCVDQRLAVNIDSH